MAHPRDGWQGQSAAKNGNHNLGGNIKSSGGYHTKGYDDGGLVFKGGTDQGEPQFEVRNQADLDAGMRGAAQAGLESGMSDRGESVSGDYGVTAGEKAAAETPDYGTGSSSTTVTPAAAAGAAAGAAAAKASAPGTTAKEAAKKIGGGGRGNRKSFGTGISDALKAGAAGAAEAGKEAGTSRAAKGSSDDSSRVPYPPPKFTGPPAPMEEDAGSFLGKAFKSVKEHFGKDTKQTKSEPVKQNRPKSNPNYKD